MDTLLWLGLAGLGFYLFEKNTVVSSLRFVEQGITFDISNLISPIINVSILVQNPTSGSLTLQSMAGTFSVNGNPSGNASYFPAVPTVLAPNAQTIIVIQLRLTDSGIITDLLNFISGSTTALNIALNGTANVNNAPIPLILSFNAVP